MRIYLEMAIGSPILLPLLLFADDLLNGGQQLGNAAFHVAGRFVSCLPNAAIISFECSFDVPNGAQMTAEYYENKKYASFAHTFYARSSSY